MENNQPQNKQRNKTILIVIFILAVLFLILGFVFVKLNTIHVAGYKYNFKTNDEIINDIKDKNSKTTIDFVAIDKKVENIKLDQVGISLDENILHQNISDVRKLSLNNLLGTNKNIDLNYKVNEDKAEKFLAEKFVINKSTFVNPTLKYNKEANSFQIVEGRAGEYVNIKNLFNNLKLKLADKNKLDVKYSEKQPVIVNDQLKDIQTELNNKLRLRINLNNKGKLVYFADPWDIAEWFKTEFNEDNKKFEIKYDKDKIRKFITDNVAKYARQEPVNSKDLYSKDGKFLQVLQNGRKGYGDIKNIDNIVEQIINATKQTEVSNIELDLQEIPNGSEKVTLNGDKWVEVNLTNQTTSLHSGDQVLQTFSISSGLTNPTPPGTFYVWLKVPQQTMTGGSKADGTYYSLPNVKWVSYFNRDIGFHSAYWHNNFGHPMSHGCINMREQDSQIVYNFTNIGTMVVVHY